jgi:hypothetical protein
VAAQQFDQRCRRSEGAARAKVDEVVAAAWSARPDAQDGAGGRPEGLGASDVLGLATEARGPGSAARGSLSVLAILCVSFRLEVFRGTPGESTTRGMWRGARRSFHGCASSREYPELVQSSHHAFHTAFRYSGHVLFSGAWKRHLCSKIWKESALVL